MVDTVSAQKPQLISKEAPPSVSQSKPAAADGKKKSFSNHFLCKFSLFLLFLVAIPLFPSQAPDFVSQAILIKFWEPVRLLFIGLAVSCGCSLFCAKNSESESLQVYHFDESHNSFVSRIFHVCPIFEDGYENLSVKKWNSNEGSQKDEIFYNEVTNRDNDTVDYEGFENPLDNNLMWSNQFIQTESIVVLSETDQETEGDKQFTSFVDYKPLDLPVRSLRGEEKSVVTENVPLQGFNFHGDETNEKFQSLSSFSHSPPKLSSSSSNSSEVNSEGDEHGESESFRASNPLKSVNGKTRLNAFHLRKYSSGSLFKRDSVEEAIEVKTLEKKHGRSSNGKSVRTLRARKIAAEESIPVDLAVADEVEVIDWPNEDKKTERNPEDENVEKEGRIEEDNGEVKNELPNGSENDDLILAAALADSSGYDSSEVDRKAGEFIAKFKEQIRLQKEASMDRARGRRISSNNFR